jgi:hypothetical protein
MVHLVVYCYSLCVNPGEVDHPGPSGATVLDEVPGGKDDAPDGAWHQWLSAQSKFDGRLHQDATTSRQITPPLPICKKNY